MLVVKIGGPAYRIGMGGGAASSLPGGSNRAELDFNAVQVSISFPSLHGASIRRGAMQRWLRSSGGWSGREIGRAHV